MDKTASELMQQIRLLQVPTALRWALLAFILLVLLAGVAAVGRGMYSSDDKLLATALGFLSSTLLGLLLLGILLTVEGGQEKLQLRTAEVLRSSIPQALGYVSANTSRRSRPARVSIEHRTGDCYAAYRVELPDEDAGEEVQAVVRLAIDLNVNKVNLTLFVPDKPFARLAKDPDRVAAFKSLFRHTVEGAAKEGYDMNPALGEWALEGVPHLAVVFVKRLPEDFLLRPTAKLYFAQDLRFFVAAVLREQGTLFARGPAKNA